MLTLIKDEDYFIIHMHHSFLYAGGAPRRAVGAFFPPLPFKQSATGVSWALESNRYKHYRQ